jgi:enterochelin esterase-like enzyme
VFNVRNTAAAILLCAIPALHAQTPTPPDGAQPPSRTDRTRRVASSFPTNTLVSPDVHDDRTVTLRYRAPQATHVSLIGEITQGKGPLPMTKDEEGVWSLTTPALPAEIWIYNFRVDGVDVVDPSNPAVKPVPPGQLISNFVEVPGDKPADYDSTAVPHGQVRMLLYESAAMGFTRTMWVYTPPGYDDSRKHYPVLYLLHGNGEEVSGWVRNGRANVIMDNLLAQGKIEPMIVVMPQGHALQAPSVEPLKRVTGETSMFSPLFPKDLMNQVIPLIEKNFHVKVGRDSRAIAGLSMGGGQALSIGLGHPELFKYVLGYSAAIGPNFLDIQDVLDKSFANPAATNKTFSLVWISCGRQDFLYKANKSLDEDLKSHGIQHKYVETEGAHVWSVWRKNLSESLPLLFR